LGDLARRRAYDPNVTLEKVEDSHMNTA
jgi:hypothetical protein